MRHSAAGGICEVHIDSFERQAHHLFATLATGLVRSRGIEGVQFLPPGRESGGRLCHC